MIVIFVEFIDQLIDYPINCGRLTVYIKVHIIHLVARMSHAGGEYMYMQLGKVLNLSN